jgi:hypothetical protein
MHIQFIDKNARKTKHSKAKLKDDRERFVYRLAADLL